MTIAIVSAAENQTDSSYAELNSFFKVMFEHFNQLPKPTITLSQNAVLSKGVGSARCSHRGSFSGHLLDA